MQNNIFLTNDHFVKMHLLSVFDLADDSLNFRLLILFKKI